jgi:2-polyprenyl-6-hydroxyphenyl methylase/3-demethylubiquinone-9 3-methyltransferase
MSDTLRAFYEDKALTYPEEDVASIVRYEKALTLAGIKAGASVLDVACKDAVLLDLLERTGLPFEYTGLDLSTRVIEKNQARKDRARARFLTADIVAGAPLPEKSFDRIFALEILEHVPQPPALLAEVRRLLKDDGRLLLSVPNPYYYMEIVNELRHFPDTDGHLYAFRDANLRALLGLCGFAVEDVVGTFFLIPKQLRGAFRTMNYWTLRRVPKFLACSRVYRCKKS